MTYTRHINATCCIASVNSFVAEVIYLHNTALVQVHGIIRSLNLVVLDRQLSLDAHVTAVCRSGYYQLRQLRPVSRSLSVEAAKSLVQAFISSRLDYCNAILHGLSDRLITLRSGAIPAETAPKTYSNKLLNLSELAGVSVKAEPHRSLNISKGVIRCAELKMFSRGNFGKFKITKRHWSLQYLYGLKTARDATPIHTS